MLTLYLASFKPVLSGSNYLWRISVNTSRDDRIITGPQRFDNAVSATSDAINALPLSSLPPGVLTIGSKCRDAGQPRIMIAWVEDDDALRSASDPWMLGRMIGCFDDRAGSSFVDASEVVKMRLNVGMSHDEIVRAAASGLQLGVRV